MSTLKYNQIIDKEMKFWDDWQEQIIKKYGYTFLHDLDKYQNKELLELPKYLGRVSVHKIIFPKINYILNFEFNKNKKMVNALNLGCGSGWLDLYLAKRGINCLGIDLSAKTIQIANSVKKEQNIDVQNKLNYKVDDLNKITLLSNQFDLIISFLTLHHIINTKHLIKQINQSLKKNGEFIVFEYMGNSSKNQFYINLIYKFLPEKIKLAVDKNRKKLILCESPLECSTQREMIDIIKQNMEVKTCTTFVCFSDYLVSKINPPRIIENVVYYIINFIDRILCFIKIVDGKYCFIIAKKKNVS